MRATTASDDCRHILIVDENDERAAVLEAGLREAGYEKLPHIRGVQHLMHRILALDPDVIVIDLENPSRDLIEQLFTVSRCVQRPIAMFVDRSDAETIAAAVDAGIAAYIVGGLKKERVKPILALAVSRFNALQRMRAELDRARAELEERKLIERAKGILMQERGLAEEAAYALLRRAAMNENRRVAEVARSVLSAATLLR